MDQMARKGMGLLFAVMLFVGLAGCKAKKKETPPPPAAANQPTAAPTNVSPTPPPEPPPPPGEEVPPVSPEIYWKLHLARLELIRDFWKKQVEIYEKHKGYSSEAEKEVAAARDALTKDLQNLFTQQGVSQKQFYARGAEERQARDKYRQDHPEVNEKFQALDTEIRELRKKVRTLIGGKDLETPPQPATEKPTEKTPPPAPGPTPGAPSPSPTLKVNAPAPPSPPTPPAGGAEEKKPAPSSPPENK